jgi:hypothetical protein
MLSTRRTAAITASIAAGVLLVSLSGCAAAPSSHGAKSHVNAGATTKAGVTAHTTATPKPTAKATPKVTPTPAPVALPANELFRITATATDLKSHAVVDLVEVVYVPAPLTSAQNALLVKLCGGDAYPGNYPNAVGISGTISATLRAGSPAWTQYSPLGIGAIMSNEVAWQGTFAPSANLLGCGTMPPIVIPSTGTAIAAISPASDPAGVSGGEGWYNSVYGWYITNDTNDAGPAGLVTISSCNLQVGAAALAGAPKVAQWPSEPNPSDDNQACEYAPLD